MTTHTGLYLGAISGTSMDGLDLALLRLGEPSPNILAGTTVPFPAALRSDLTHLALAQGDDLALLGSADARLGRFIGTAVLEFLSTQQLSAGQIQALGCHGQTVRHQPQGPAAYSLQIGDPNLIAELTGLPVVADFRRRDLAAGGQGAPLVPLFHQALFQREQDDLVLNIGGIANLTWLRADPRQPLLGFDTGPGNALLDAWISHCQSLTYDANGAWGASGQVQPALLARLLADPYFQQAPPKSTGKEQFNLHWLLGALEDFPNLASADVQATLAALTVQSIVKAIADLAMQPARLILCGGGRLNLQLQQGLVAALPATEVISSDSLGVNGDWLEAGAFAWLAARRLAGLPGNAAAVTGAAGPRILGGLYLP